jgi:hypothetical protein
VKPKYWTELQLVPGMEKLHSNGSIVFEDDLEWPDTELVTYEHPGKILQYEMRLWSRPRLFGLTEGAAVYGENGWVLLANNWPKA